MSKQEIDLDRIRAGHIDPIESSVDEIRSKLLDGLSCRLLELRNQACLSNWFPKIEAAGLPVPKTHIIRTSVSLLSMLDDGCEVVGFESLITQIQAMVRDVGPPAFLRTGQTSGKHEWDRCCYLSSANRETIQKHVLSLVEYSEMVDFLGLPTDVWVVREYLPVKPIFRCLRYGNFPVVPEWRVVVNGGKFLYTQPYWPDGALEEGQPDDPDWKQVAEIAFTLSLDDWSEVKRLAERAGHAVGGKWSVDILLTDRGFFVTDMAPAEISYGWNKEKAGE